MQAALLIESGWFGDFQLISPSNRLSDPGTLGYRSGPSEDGFIHKIRLTSQSFSVFVVMLFPRILVLKDRRMVVLPKIGANSWRAIPSGASLML